MQSFRATYVPRLEYRGYINGNGEPIGHPWPIATGGAFRPRCPPTTPPRELHRAQVYSADWSLWICETMRRNVEALVIRVNHRRVEVSELRVRFALLRPNPHWCVRLPFVKWRFSRKNTPAEADGD